MVKVIIFFTFIVLSGSLYSEERCFDNSKRINISGFGQFNGLIPSPDKTKLIVYDQEGKTFSVYDLKTGESKTFEKPVGSAVAFNSNNEIAYQAKAPGENSGSAELIKNMQKFELGIIDISTGKKRTQKGGVIDVISGQVGYDPKLVGDNLYFSNQGKNVFRYHKTFFDEHSAIHVNFANNLTDPDIINDEQNNIILRALDGKKIMDISGEDLNGVGRFSSDKKNYSIGAYKNNMFYILSADLISKKIKMLKLPETYYLAMGSTGLTESQSLFDPEKKIYLLTPFDRKSPLVTFNSISGEVSYLKDVPLIQAVFDKSGNICGFYSKNENEYKCFDQSTHKEISSDTVAIDTMSSLSFFGDSKTYLMQRRLGQDDRESLIIIPAKACIDFKTFEQHQKCQNLSNDPANKKPENDFIKINEKLLCEKDFDKNSWQLKAKDYDEDQALLWLKKISKPDSLDLKEDLLVLDQIVKSGVALKYPKEVSAALIGLASSNLSVYDDFVRQNPELLNLPEPDESCLTANEKEKIMPKLESYIDYFVFNNAKSIEGFSKLKNIMAFFSTKEKDDFADSITYKILANADQDYQLKGIFTSKLYKFYYNNLKKSFGLPFKDLTDVTFTRADAKVNMIELSMKPTDGAVQTSTGLYLKNIETVDPTTLVPNVSKALSHEWTYSGATYKSQINIEKILPKEALVKNIPSPEYQKMGGGKEFNGLIIAGSNLGKDLTDSIVRSYIDYYVKEGFDFAKPKTEEHLDSYLKDRITGEHPIHYIVKEAHSDGDEKNLFRVASKGKVLLGTRIKNGKKETIEIAYPFDEKSDTKLISNEDFGKWIKEREKTSNQPLVYVNSSCWSTNKAVNEITAAASPLLINIPTTTSMTVFDNDKDNAMRIVIDGLRKQKTYKEMRKNMSRDPDYVSKKGNVFIFPDEEEYKSKISNLVAEPVNVGIQITKKLEDNSWKNYSIEEEH